MNAVDLRRLGTVVDRDQNTPRIARKISVTAIETTIDPRQPMRFEKKIMQFRQAAWNSVVCQANAQEPVSLPDTLTSRRR
jgi:hypothetical protein